jgi:hypothetical protein
MLNANERLQNEGQRVHDDKSGATRLACGWSIVLRCGDGMRSRRAMVTRADSTQASAHRLLKCRGEWCAAP